jgi:hypothetical protein
MKFRTCSEPINFQKDTQICSRLISTQFSTVTPLSYFQEDLEQLTTPGKPEAEKEGLQVVDDSIDYFFAIVPFNGYAGCYGIVQ